MRDIGKRICTAFGAEPDPLQRVDLNDTEIGGGRLADEAAAIPMFGDKKLVLVRGGGGQVARTAKIIWTPRQRPRWSSLRPEHYARRQLSASWPKAMTRPWRFPAMRPMHAKFRN